MVILAECENQTRRVVGRLLVCVVVFFSTTENSWKFQNHPKKNKTVLYLAYIGILYYPLNADSSWKRDTRGFKVVSNFFFTLCNILTPLSYWWYILLLLNLYKEGRLLISTYYRILYTSWLLCQTFPTKNLQTSQMSCSHEQHLMSKELDDLILRARRVSELLLGPQKSMTTIIWMVNI